MKNKITLILTALVCLFSLTETKAQNPFVFTNSANIVVYRVGAANAGSLVNSGMPVYLMQYSNAGSVIDSFAVPSTGSNAIVTSGTATVNFGSYLQATQQ